MLRNLSTVGQRTRIQTQGIWLRVAAPNHTTRYSNIQSQTNSEMACFTQEIRVMREE